MTDEWQPGETRSVKASASGHGQAYTSQRDMTNQEITIKDSVILVVTRRAEETIEREQHAENLLSGVDELKKRLTAMTEAARIAATRLKQEVKRAREEGRAEALAEAEFQLQNAERRRAEVEVRLKQAQDERERATQLMQQAQLQALDARNELAELRRREQLEAELAQALPMMQRAADEGGTARQDAYEDQIAFADAELGDLRDQLAQLSVELKESSEAELETGAADTFTSLADPPRADASRADAPSASPAEGYPSAALSAPNSSDQQQGTTADSAAPPSLRRPVSSLLIGLAASAPILAGFGIDGAGINIVMNASPGPAIFWQIVFAVSATAALLVLTIIVLAIYMGIWPGYRRASTICIGLSMFLGPIVLIAAIVWPSPDMSLLGPAAHWLVHHFGPK